MHSYRHILLQQSNVYNLHRFAINVMESEVHVESGLQLLARLNSRPSLDRLNKILFPNGLKTGEIVEISGDVSSGKTLLLTQLLAKCILPTKKNGVFIGGLGAGAIFMNTDHHFRMSKLSGFMFDMISESYKSTHKDQPSDELMTAIIQSSLARLIIIECYSSYQFKLAVLSLESLILDHENIAVLMIDSISAFYWEDRVNENIWLKDSYLKNILRTVQKCISHFIISLIYTIPSDFFSKDKSTTETLTFENINHWIKLSRTSTLKKTFCVIESNDCGKKTIEYEIDSCGIKWLNST